MDENGSEPKIRPQSARIRSGSTASAREIPPAIQWYEGMLLAPQHFQQQSLRAEASLRYNLAYAAPYHWGVRNLRINESGVGEGKLEIEEVEAVMPDGLVVSSAVSGGEGLTLDLHPLFESSSRRSATLYLAVMARREGVSPVEGDMARYQSNEGEDVRDENTSQSEVSIPRLLPRLLLLTEDQLALNPGSAPEARRGSRYVHFPIARVKYEDGSFSLLAYEPPSLRVALDSKLGETCAELCRKLREKAQFLSGQVHSPTLGLRASQFLETKIQIASLVSALPAFEALLYSGVAHPFPLFLGLCDLVGQTAILSKRLSPGVLPAYDHHDLLTIFGEARDRIYQAIEEGIIESYTGFPFFLQQGAFYLAFDKEWLHRKLVLGVRAREGVSEGEIVRWMESAKIASRSKIAAIRGTRTDGLKRTQSTGDRDLVPAGGTSLYELEPNPQYLVPGELLEIQNLDAPLAPWRPVEIILYVSKDIPSSAPVGAEADSAGAR